AVRERNVLTAGTAAQPGVLVLEPGPGKKTVATVRGPGRVELFDAAANANTITATWQTSLTHTKETVNDREVDLLTFTGGAMFEDKQADYWLKGKVLKLWLQSAKADAEKVGKKADAPAQPLPHRLQAIGDVTSHSAEFDIEQAE